MSGNSEFEQRHQVAQDAVIRNTVCEVHAEAANAGLTEPGALEDFIVGALQLEWPWLSDDRARDLTRRYLPRLGPG